MTPAEGVRGIRVGHRWILEHADADVRCHGEVIGVCKHGIVVHLDHGEKEPCRRILVPEVFLRDGTTLPLTSGD